MALLKKEWCSLAYARVDDAARRLIEMEVGTQLAKLDLQSAYRHVSVHQDDRPLLGMRWKGNVCLDAALPFGLRSAPKIFSAVADALLWVMYGSGVTSALHYLEDFFIFGKPGTSECANNLSICRDLGLR